MITEKECLSCKDIKPRSDFYNVSKKREKASPGMYAGGIDYYCKYCRNGNSLRSHWNNSKKKRCSLEDCDKPHYAKSYCRTHYSRLIRNGTTDPKWIPVGRNETRQSDSNVKIYAPNGNVYEYERRTYYNRKNYLKHNWNLDIEEYDRMCKDGCQICKQDSDINFHVDHDHTCCPAQNSCGKCIRGIVCARCNMLVDKYERGTIRKDNQRLPDIIKYLDKYKKKRAKLDGKK